MAAPNTAQGPDYAFTNTFTVVQAAPPAQGGLYCQVDNLGPAAAAPGVLIAPGVQSLKIYYGVKRNFAFTDYNVDTYLTADQMCSPITIPCGTDDWSNISAVRVVLNLYQPTVPAPAGAAVTRSAAHHCLRARDRGDGAWRGAHMSARGARATLERGMALISSLLLLLIITILALSMFRSFGSQEKIAGNLREKERALHAAESVQQYAEWWLTQPAAAATPPVSCAAGPALNANAGLVQICTAPDLGSRT